MNPFTAFHRGIRRALRTGRLAVYTWLAGFLFSLLWVIPVGSFLHGNYGRSPLWQAMGDGFSWTWLGDAIFRHGDLPALIAGGLLAMTSGWLLLSVYLNGGLIAGLALPRRRFLGDCGEYFPRLLRLFLLSLPVYLIAVLGATLLAELLRALNPDPVTEWGELWRQWARLGLLAAALAVVNLVFDLAKIALVRRQDGKAWRALGEVVTRLRGRACWQAGTVYLLAAGVSCARVLAYLEIARQVPTRLGWVLLGLLPLQQGLMLARQWSRLLCFAAESEWWEG
ncbi:MAG TPA: hypothetical protein PKK12_00740, partial [Candidatus Aminicenantes bacterium]|nr:hypothetical protein [Candidatus Aminicenantes bacterium]